MANIIHINKLDCEDSIIPRKGKDVPNGFRKATLQGSLLTTPARNPRPHTGGGMRGPQWGHDWRSEKTILRFLMTCHIPKYYFSFTFPKPVGPEDSKKHIKKFLKELNKIYKYSAVTKMEVQPGRMSGEFMMLLWTDASIDKADIQDLWNKVIGEEGRIYFDFVDEDGWPQLAKYFSKKVLIRPGMVQVGEWKYQVLATDDQSGYFIETISKDRRNHLVRDSQNRSTSHTPEPVSKKLYDEWLNYSGRFVHKHSHKAIPRYKKEQIYIKDDLDNNLRNNHINPYRKEHFVGKNQGYSVVLNFMENKDNKHSKNFNSDNDFTEKTENNNKENIIHLIERSFLIIIQYIFRILIYLSDSIRNLVVK